MKICTTVNWLYVCYTSISLYFCTKFYGEHFITATCSFLPGPVNGGILFDKSPIGQVNYLRYPKGKIGGFYCNSGYIISGGASATCRSPPGWSIIGSTVSCIAMVMSRIF